MSIFSRSLPARLAWHGLAVLILVYLPVLKYHMWWWDLRRRELLPLIVLLGAYGISALAVMLFVKTDGWRAALRALGITLSVFSLVLMALLTVPPTLLDVPRYLVLPIFAAAAVLVPLSVGPDALRIAGTALLGAALLGVAVVSLRSVHATKKIQVKVAESDLKTAFYALHMVKRDGVVPMPATRGGGLDRVGDQVLLGTGDGALYLITPQGNELKAQRLATRVPANRQEFAAAFGGSANAPSRFLEYREVGPPRIQTWRFRVADVITQTRGDDVRIFASHHFWKAAEQCFTVRVSEFDAKKDQLAAAKDSDWRTVFEAKPCIPMTGKLRKRGKNPFRGEEVGGRLALLDEHTLLLTLGDHGFYGAESAQAFSQDPTADYGKTIRIDLNTHEGRIYTLGHRNSQGLYKDPENRLWLTEHAAQGGDELNLLVEGANYGWPLVTYGTDYGTFAWQFSQQQGHHVGFAQPRYAWVPSIGISNLIGMRGDKFPIWKGDLMIGSLATRSLYRVVLDGERVVVVEPIPIGGRIRDLLELNDGRLLLWTDEAALITLEPASGMSGAMQFSTLCSGCHQSVDGISHRIGPDLYRIVNRKVASAPGYDEYSQALQQFGGVWTKERLDQFLRDPQSATPGTTMAFDGLQDDAARAALIDYLDTLVIEATGNRP
jgi:aldose sugar dehydrogenase